MEPKTVYKAIIKIYEEFYRQATLRGNYEFRNYAPEVRLICKFIKWFRKRYKEQQSIEVLIKYFEFQFSHYSGIQTKYGKNSIVISWIIGPKAIQRWEDRELKKHWLVRIRLKKEVDLKLREAFKEDKKSLKVLKTIKMLQAVHPAEEKDKQRYYNTPKGFVYCMTTTTLFNPNSRWCEGCTNREDCQIILEKNLPKIYKIRCQKN